MCVGYQMNRFFIVSLSSVSMAMVLSNVLSLNDFMLQSLSLVAQST